MDTHATNTNSNIQAPMATAKSAVFRERVDARRRRLTLIVALFIAAGLIVAFSLNANGQGVKYDKMKWYPQFDDAKTLRLMEKAASDISRAKDLSAVSNANYGRIYFSNYLPAKLTQPNALKDISKLTQSATKQLASAQRGNYPGAPQIAAWLFAGMKQVAEGNYHPAARINALVVIGRLDSKLADTTAKKPPVPYAQAFPVLRDQYLKKSNPDGVRAAALKGLHRYISVAFPTLRPQDTAPIVAAMNELLDSEAPEGRDRLAHAYLQRFAVDILALLEPAKGGTLGERLVSISTEPTRHNMIALYSLSRLSDAGGTKKAAENPDQVLDNLAVRAMRAFQYELARLEMLDGIGNASSQPPRPEDVVVKREDQTAYVPGQYGGYGDDEDYEEEMDDEDDGGGFEEFMDEEEDYDEEMDDGDGFYTSSFTGNPQPPEVKGSRRRLNHVLQQIHIGVSGSPKAGVPSRPGGILAAVADDKKRPVEKWLEAMEELVTALNNPIEDDRAKFKAMLELQIETIKELAGAAGEEAAAEDEKVPIGLNPYANLARLSGVPLEKLGGVKPAAAPVVVPAAAEATDAADQPPAKAPAPPVGAAASTATPAPTGS